MGLGGAGAQTTEAVTSWLQVDAGLGHTCAIASTHALHCWGSNAFGALGTGGGDASSPAPVAGAFSDWSTVPAGDLLTCGIRNGGHLFCWGSDAFGGVGDGGGHHDRAVPTEVAGSHRPWASVSVGGDGRRSSGRLYCWGWNIDGQIGHPVPGADVTAPVRVSGGFTDWQSVVTGESHTCGLRTGGALYCWGFNGGGAVGNGSTSSVNVPVSISG